MMVNLIKLAVGVESVDHLQELQSKRLVKEKSSTSVVSVIHHITKNFPRRAIEILDGGSMYWVIKRVIKVRQKIVGIERMKRSDGKASCALILDSHLIRTMPRSFRAFQGWRYFSKSDAPNDIVLSSNMKGHMPQEMTEELQDLGLL